MKTDRCQWCYVEEYLISITKDRETKLLCRECFRDLSDKIDARDQPDADENELAAALDRCQKMVKFKP